jgi:hypothetical protein
MSMEQKPRKTMEERWSIMRHWFGFDFSQASTKRGLMMIAGVAATYLVVPVEYREEALLAVLGSQGLLGTFLKD